MKNWYRNYQKILEAPISDIETRNIDQNLNFGSGSSFDKIDKNLIHSKPHIERVVNAFKKTPHIFKVIFMDNESIDSERDNSDPDQIALDNNAGIHDEFLGIKGEYGKIIVIMLSNLANGDTRMPMTPWTLAHKIRHSFQDNMMLSGNTIIKRQCYLIFRQINLIAESDDADNLSQLKSIYSKREPSQDDSDFNMANLSPKLTMKSARTSGSKGLGYNDFEAFAEIIAQYLIQGKVNMNNISDQSLVDKLNDQIDTLFRLCSGKVLVEV